MTSREIWSAIVIVLTLVSIFPSSITVAKDQPYMNHIGRGAEGDPIVIEDIWDLQNITQNLTAYYIVMKDIDASITREWNGGDGFQPIGNNYSNRFSGCLDGRDYAITGLTVKGLDRIGLFGQISDEGVVKNIRLIDTVVSGREYIGGLCAVNYGTISNCTVEGVISGSSYVGGLVGYNGNLIMNTSFNGSIVGNSYTGGITGLNSGMVSNSHYNYNDVLINGISQITIGALYDGQYDDWISKGWTLNISDYSDTLLQIGDIYCIGDVNGLRDLLGFSDRSGLKFKIVHDIDLSNEPGFYIPYFFYSEFDGNNLTISNLSLEISMGAYLGLFGYNDRGSIKNIILKDYEIIGGSYSGGLIGFNAKGEVVNCDTFGKIEKAESVGGLIGSNTGPIIDCHASVDALPMGSWICAGGVAGGNYGTIMGCSAYGNLTGSGQSGRFGGLVGDNNGDISNCYSKTNVDEKTASSGGAVGWNGGSINHTYSGGMVNGRESGGLVGVNRGSINNSYANGNVTGINYAGGLIGSNGIYWKEVFVSNSFAAGNVDGDSNVGGLIGHNSNAIILDCYALGDVNGDHNIGGLIGSDGIGKFSCCYSSGRVTGIDYVGGLIGSAYGSMVSNCFWDEDTSGRFSSSGGGTGKSTKEMKMRTTYENSDWDLVEIWTIINVMTYPFLRWQDKEGPHAFAGPDIYINEDTKVELEGNRSTDDFGIANYTWSLFDRQDIRIYGAKGEYYFDNPGTFNVTLNVTDAADRWQMDNVMVTVADIHSPEANAGPDLRIHEGDTATFNGSISEDNDRITNWTWSFFDLKEIDLYGATSTYRFVHPGDFTVILNVTDPSGRWDSDILRVAVSDINDPVANAGPDIFVDMGTMVMFDAGRSYDTGSITNCSWRFDYNGTMVDIYGVTPMFMFGLPDVYEIILTVKDSAGHNGYDQVKVFVRDTVPPTADAGPDIIVDQGWVVLFDGSGSSDNVGIADYNWTFSIENDPISLHGIQAQCRFDSIGSFIIILIVTDTEGNWQYDKMGVTVRDGHRPVADAGPDMIVPVLVFVGFDGSESTDNVGIVNYTWTIEREVHLYGQKPHYVFSDIGRFRVSLEVTDARRLRAWDEIIVTVVDTTSPVADAGQDRIVLIGEPVELDGGQSTDNLGIVNYQWTIEIGILKLVLYGVETVHTFDISGVYNITLTVRDTSGNVDSDSMILIVNEKDQKDKGSFIMYVWGTLAFSIVILSVSIVILSRKKRSYEEE